MPSLRPSSTRTFAQRLPFRRLTTAASPPRPSDAYLASSSSRRPPAELTPALDSALRVDHAGEVAANWIYRGQYAVLGRDKDVGPVIQEMWNQEKKHLEVMNKLQKEYRVRPTVLLEVAKVLGWGLGAATAMMGKEAAMACTEAVETVIGEHYDDQLKELATLPASEANSQIQALVRELRDDELEHLDTAVDFHSQRAAGHALLTAAVEAGCGVAIKLCQRI